MKVLRLIACGLLLVSGCAPAQNVPDPPTDAAKVIPLYSGVAPGSESWTWQEKISTPPWGGSGRLVRNVVRPTLTLFQPPADKSVHTAVIVAPGGGFRWLSIDSEGYDVARALTARGITALVLKYRLDHTADEDAKFLIESLAFLRSLASDKPPVVSGPRMKAADSPAIRDGIEAVHYVRAHTGELGVDKDRVGMLGFSAGGIVTVGVICDGDGDSKLNFAAPIYGAFNSDGHWPGSTPPMFLAVAADDTLAAKAEIDSFMSLRAQKLPAELHVFESGGHGFGMLKKGTTSDAWLEEFLAWMNVRH
jgi:acetyl esterase/lipase